MLDAVDRRRAGVNPVRRVGLVAHPDRAEAADLVRHTREWAASNDIDAPRRRRRPSDAVDDSYDAVLSFGGDGTMLRTVDLVADADVPVLGVNCGQMGYLTGVEPGALDDALERLRTGDFAVSERTVLAVRVESTGAGGRAVDRAQRGRGGEAAPRASSCGSRS